MTVLITGNRGYLGSVVCKYFDYVGYDIADGYDVLDTECLQEKLESVDAVIHLAGIVGEQACNADVGRAYKVNGIGTLHLVDLARRAGIQKLITVSTCSIYGEAGNYADSKLLAEIVTRAYGYMVARLGSLYGGDKPSDSLPEYLLQLAKENREFFVYGPQQWRPVVHVEDAAHALVFLLPLASVPHKFDVVGENITKGDLAKLIASKYDVKVHFNQKEGDGYRVEGKALRDVGFKFEHSLEGWLNDSVMEASK